MPEIASMLRAAEAALASRWGPVQLEAEATLDGSSRAVVVRASVAGAPGAPPTVVVKAHRRSRAPEGAVREPAALDLLTGLGVQGAPELLAVATEPALVVMQDLGTSAVSLADLLLGSDPDAASDGLIAWASTMGALHVQTAAAGEAFAAALAAHGTRLDAPAPTGDDMPAMLGSVAGKLPGRLSDLLGVAMPAAAAEEVRSLADLLPAGAAGALTPADACPDNNSLQPGGMVLFDFEEAAYRHVAWDAAYL